MLNESIKKFLYAVGEGVAHEAKKVAPYREGFQYVSCISSSLLYKED